jgi:uncharacterized membrane protein YbhN (UPF0104 family)
MNKKIPLLANALFAILLFAGAAYTIRVKLAAYEPADILAGLSHITSGQITAAILLTILSYITLIGYDLVALFYLRKWLPLPKIAFTSVLSYIFSNNLSFTLLTGNAIRYRYYKKFGLSTIEVAQLISVCIATFWVGLAVAGGVGLYFSPLRLPDTLLAWLPIRNLSAVGALLLGITIAYLVLSLVIKRSFTVFKHRIHFPNARVALLQIGVALVDWYIASLCLYVLLPSPSPISFSVFFAAFIVAQIAGLISHVPGGLGVFDTVILWALTPELETSVVFGYLLVYRFIYYFGPLLLAFVAFTVYEISQQKSAMKNLIAFLKNPSGREPGETN